MSYFPERYLTCQYCKGKFNDNLCCNCKCHKCDGYLNDGYCHICQIVQNYPPDFYTIQIKYINIYESLNDPINTSGFGKLILEKE